LKSSGEDASFSGARDDQTIQTKNPAPASKANGVSNFRARSVIRGSNLEAEHRRQEKGRTYNTSPQISIFAEETMSASNWTEFLTRGGARLADDHSIGFDEAGMDAVRESTAVVVPLTHVGLIRASGEEAGVFLQNLLTNDTRKVGPDQAQYSSFCSPKGRMLASFLIWREDSDYLLQLSRDLHAGILKKLGMYVLRTKVKLSDASEDYALFGIAGSGSTELVAEFAAVPEATMGVAVSDRGTVIRLGEQRFQLAIEAAEGEAVWNRIRTTARPAGTAAWRWLEINAGIPQITSRTREEFVPQMANFELIGGVSFNKGCYPGQEIVARTQYLGKLKRRMYLAHVATGEPPAPGTPIYGPELPDQSCGTVMSSAPAPEGGSDLLAVIQISCAEAGNVHVGAADGPRLVLRSLPYALS
jgi:folate-binding protein YgfZ